MPKGTRPLTTDPSDRYLTGPVASHTFSDVAMTVAGSSRPPADRPAGGAARSGLATISVSGKTGLLCWTFSRLVGVPDPTLAHINSGSAGSNGSVEAMLGAHYAPSGCVGPLDEILIDRIANNGSNAYVAIDDTKTNAGTDVDALRGQLAPG